MTWRSLLSRVFCSQPFHPPNPSPPPYISTEITLFPLFFFARPRTAHIETIFGMSSTLSFFLTAFAPSFSSLQLFLKKKEEKEPVFCVYVRTVVVTYVLDLRFPLCVYIRETNWKCVKSVKSSAAKIGKCICSTRGGREEGEREGSARCLNSYNGIPRLFLRALKTINRSGREGERNATTVK